MLLVGINYQSSPLEVREKIAISPGDLRTSLRELYSYFQAQELLILSTCNRTEIYGIGVDESKIYEWFVARSGLRSIELDGQVYSLTNQSAVEHLYKVASGLDSMVLGETQILGQIKDAYRICRDEGTIGLRLGKIFEHGFSVAKAIRSNTDIGTQSISLGAATLKVAERIFPDLMRRTVLFVGAGEMIRICLDHFTDSGISDVNFTNRSSSAAENLAGVTGGNFFPLEELPNQLERMDIIVSCTASPVPLIGKGAIERAISNRRHRPILIVDLAVPRDVEVEVGKVDDVFLFSIDDMQDIVSTNMKIRRSAAREAETLINDGVKRLYSWLDGLEVTPALKKFREFGERISEAELKKALDDLSKGSPPEDVVRSLSRAIMNKFLHRPSRLLATANDRKELAKVLLRLHLLQDGE